MSERAPVPDLLTIAEAARLLRVGRSAAYEQARVWRETEGQAGLPTVTVGHSLRVPRVALEQMLGRPVRSVRSAERRSKQSSARVVNDQKKSANNGEHADGKELRADEIKDQISNEQISSTTKGRGQPVSKRPVDTCHPFGEAVATAPVAPSLAPSRRSRDARRC